MCTSLLSQAKEAGNMGNIGPAYVALNDPTVKLINGSGAAMDFKVSSTPVTTGSGDINLDAGALSEQLYYAWSAGSSGPPIASAQVPGGAAYVGFIAWNGGLFSFGRS